ncbi:hypothetical protein M8J77_026200 [Diaphorina citri]|nr:hypothetical protein M8J77_026200 [Diaphorina citri]
MVSLPACFYCRTGAPKEEKRASEQGKFHKENTVLLSYRSPRAFAGRKNELAGRMRPAGRGLDKPDLEYLFVRCNETEISSNANTVEG